MADPFFQQLDELAQSLVSAPAGARPQLSNQPTVPPAPAAPAAAPPAAVPAAAPTEQTVPAAPPDEPGEAPPTMLQQIDTILSAQPQRDPLAELDRLAALNDPDRSSAFTRGVQRGLNQAQQIPSNLGAIYNQLTGDEEAAIASAQHAQAIERQAPVALMPDLRDIHGWRDFTTYLAEKLGEQTVNIGSSMVAGGLGGLLTRMGARSLFGTTSVRALERAQVLGTAGFGAVPNVAFETSGTTGELFEATGQVHPGVSLAAGGVKGVLESLTPFALSRTVGLIPGVSSIRMSSIPGAIARHGLLEAGTELSQEAVDMAARSYVDPTYNPWDAEGVWRLLNAGVAGGVVGGSVGGAGRAMAGRYPSGFSRQLPPGTVDAMQAGGGIAQENGAPSGGPTTGVPAPSSPVEQAIAAVQRDMDLQQAQTSRSPIPAMYREVLGRKMSQTTQSHLLSDGGVSQADPVVASEIAQQSRDYRASVLDDAESVLGERALPRYRVLRKGTHETVGGMPSEALTPRAVEDAMAEAGSQNIQLERVDYSQMDKRAITASLHDLPYSLGDPRIYFIAGTTPDQQTKAAVAFSKIRTRRRRGTPEIDQAGDLQDSQRLYTEALSNGMRILPRYGDSFLYLMDLPTVPTTERPATTRVVSRRAEVNTDGTVTLTPYTHDRALQRDTSQGSIPYKAFDLAQIPGADVELARYADAPLALRAKVREINEAEVLSPFQFRAEAEDREVRRLTVSGARADLEYTQHIASVKTIPPVSSEIFDTPNVPSSVMREVRRIMPLLEKLAKAVMLRAGVRHPIRITWGQEYIGSQFHLARPPTNFDPMVHHIELYSPKDYTHWQSMGMSVEQTLLNIFKHEMGHALTIISFFRLPMALRTEILASWQQARLFAAQSHLGAQNVAGMLGVTDLEAEARLSSVMTFNAGPSYHLTLTEWWAEQARRWMDTDAGVAYAQDTLFKRFAKNFSDLETVMRQQLGKAAYRTLQAEKPIHWWMEYMRRTAQGETLSDSDVKDMIRYRLGVEPRLNDMSYFPKLQGERLNKALVDAVAAMLDRLPPGVQIKVDTLDTFEGQQAGAYYYPAEKLLVLSKAALENSTLLRTLKHEEVHILRGLFEADEWMVLRNAAADYFKARPWRPGQRVGQLEALYRRVYGRNYQEMHPNATAEEMQAFVNDMIDEERVAYFLERRQQFGESFGERLNALLDRIIEFLRELKNALLRHDFPSLRQIIHDIESGMIAQRAAVGLSANTLDQNLKRERMGYVEQAPHYTPGIHINADELQEISRQAVDAWHGTPHEFATEVELTHPDGRKQFVSTETKLSADIVAGIRNGSIEVGVHPYGRFALQKIGTGEGAQVYGYGLYFTQTEGIAKHYRRTLSRANVKLLPDTRIAWDKLPGGLKAKPIWEAVFNFERANSDHAEAPLDRLVQHITYGAFLALGIHGVTSNYYGHERAIRAILKTAPGFTEAQKKFDEVTYPAYKARIKDAETEWKSTPYNTPRYNQLSEMLLREDRNIDKQRDELYVEPLKYFGFTDEQSPDEIITAVIEAAGNRSFGYVYKVKINTADDAFILYDKPLSEQSDLVKKAFEYSGPAQIIAPFSVREWKEETFGPRTDHWLKVTYKTPKAGTISQYLGYVRQEKPSGGQLLGNKASYAVFVPIVVSSPTDSSWGLAKTFSTLEEAKNYLVQELPNTQGGKNFIAEIQARLANVRGSELVPRQEHQISLLQQKGIKGVKYLDGMSRSKGEGRYNYVIFDESVIDIVERNGTPVSSELKAAAVEYFKSKLDRRAALTGRTRYSGDVRDEAGFKPDFIAHVEGTIYVAGETYNGDNSRDLKSPDIANLYFFQGPRTGRLIGDVDTQLQGLGSMMGYLQLSKKPDGYETDYVNVRPDFRGQHLATIMQNWAGKKFNFSPKPSGILLRDGYRMWQHRDPQAVKYYQKTSDGDYLSPTVIKATYHRSKAQIEMLKIRGREISPILQDRFDEMQMLLRRIPAEGFEENQLAKHYEMDEAKLILNQVAIEQRYAEEQRTEQQVLAATPILREAAAKVQRRITGLDVLEQKPKEGELETPPAFRMASMLGHIFNDPNASPEDKNVSRYLTGTLIPEVDKITKYGQKFLGLKQLVQRNPHLQGLADYDILVDQWNAERMKWIANGDTVMRSWRSLPQDEQQRLGELLFYMTEMEYRSNAEVSTGVVRQPTQAEVVHALQRFRITPEGAAVFDAINTQFTDFLASLEATLTTELNKAYTPGTPAHAQALTDLQNDFTGMRSRPYFPFMRHGRHTVTVRNAATREVLWFSTYERVSERDNAVPQIVRQYARGTVDVSVGLLPENVSQYQGMPPALLRHIADNLIGVTAAQKEWIEQLIYDKSPSQAFRRRLANRSGVSGYSREAQRAFASYFMYGGAHLARLQYKRVLQEKVDQVRSDGRRLAAEVRRSMIADYMQEHLTYIMESGRDAFRFKALITLWYLAFSPAAAAANLTQVPMVTWPLLTSYFGQAKGNAALMRAYASHKLRKGKPTPQTISPGYDKVRQQLIDEGYISIGLASELAGYSAGRTAVTATVGTSGARMLQDFTWYGMYLFQMAETFNREVTTAATYELVMKNPTANIVTSTQARYIVQITSLASKLNISIQEATAFFVIKNVIDQTQFNYSDFAHAPFMRSKATQALMPFVGYLQGALFAFGNNPGRAKMILALVLMGGLLALPGADDLDKAVKLLARRMFGKDFSLEKFTREMVGMVTKGTKWDMVAADVLLHGLGRVGGPQGLLPDSWGVPRFDWSGNISLGRTQGLNELLQSAASGRKFSDLTNQVSQQAGGPTYGMMYSMLQFLYSNPFSATAREWEAAMPRGAKAVAKMMRWISQGAETTRSGARLPGTDFDLSQWTDRMELLTQALGFTPTRVRVAWENYALYTELDGWYKAQRSWLYEALDQAVRTDNTAMHEAALADIQNFNAAVARDGFGSYTITAAQIQNSLRNRAMARGRIENDIARSKGGASTMQHIEDLRPNVYDTRRVR